MTVFMGPLALKKIQKQFFTPGAGLWVQFTKTV